MKTAPHGSRERYKQGCACDGCRLMMVLHTKSVRPVRVVESGSSKRDAEPYAKLLRALLRDGYTLRQLAQRADFSAKALQNIALGVTVWVYPDTGKAIDRLVATLPSQDAVSA